MVQYPTQLVTVIIIQTKHSRSAHLMIMIVTSAYKSEPSPPGLPLEKRENEYDIKCRFSFVFAGLKVTWESALITRADDDTYPLWNSLRGKGDLCSSSMFNKLRHFTKTRKKKTTVTTQFHETPARATHKRGVNVRLPFQGDLNGIRWHTFSVTLISQVMGFR